MVKLLINDFIFIIIFCQYMKSNQSLDEKSEHSVFGYDDCDN